MTTLLRLALATTLALGACGDPDGAADGGPDGDGACLAEGSCGDPSSTCCAGLSALDDSAARTDGSCAEPGERRCCARCGDGACGPGENACSCPADCADSGCVQEGGALVFYPGAPSCCAGLEPVGCEAPGEAGDCIPCAGSSFCVRCGDGLCGLGENGCNCKDDC